MIRRISLFLFLVISLLLFYSGRFVFSTSPTLTWTTRSSMPTPRYGLAVATASNGKIYAVGGSNAFGLVAALEEYDPASDSWTTKANNPTPRWGLALVSANDGKLYALGGFIHEESLTIVEEYNPATDTWTTKNSMPTSRHTFGIAEANNGKIYAIGGGFVIPGSSSTFVRSAVEEYDPLTDTWITKSPMPTARGGLGVAMATNGKIYAIGGFTQDAPVITSETVEEYDPATDTWATKTPMPTPRFNLAVVAANNGKIYAIGGTNSIGDLPDTVEEYDPATDTWTTVESIPTPRFNLGASLGTNGKIYVIGGFVGGSPNLTNVVEEATFTDQPPTDKMATGSYVGDGVSGRTITGLGFQPEIVLIKVNYSHPLNSNLSSAVMRTSAMDGDNAKPLRGSQAMTSNLIQSLDPDGFTVGNELRVNDASTCSGPCTYYWVAFNAGSNTKVGSYVGNGAASQDITAGFTFSPEYVVVMPENNQYASHRTYLFGINSNPFLAGGPMVNAITALLANGFRVGTDRVNTSGVTYHYVAWNEVAGWMKIGSYLGNTSDNRSISGVGFQPEYVIVQSAIGGRDPIQRSDAMLGDASVNFRGSLSPNRIQALEADGFQVGSYTAVNASLEDFFYVAFNK